MIHNFPATWSKGEIHCLGKSYLASKVLDIFGESDCFYHHVVFHYPTKSLQKTRARLKKKIKPFLLSFSEIYSICSFVKLRCVRWVYYWQKNFTFGTNFFLAEFRQHERSDTFSQATTHICLLSTLCIKLK